MEVAHTLDVRIRGKADRRSGKGRVVTLLVDNNVPSEGKKMYCLNCGMVVFHYYGAFKIVIMGDMKETKTISRPVDLMCNTCKMVYRIA